MSCLMVILCHCSNLQIEPSATFTEFGTPAVYFFFVLSGYLLMSRGLAEIQRSRGDVPQRFFGEKFFNFSIKRIARIYPAYFVAIWLYYGIVWLTKCYDFKEFVLKDFDRSIWASLFFSGMESHFWTIANEWYFYTLVLPVILCVAAELMILDHKYFHVYRRFSLVVPFYIIVTAYVTCQQYQIGNVETGYPDRYDFKVHIPAFWHGSLGGIASYYTRYYFKIHLNITPIKNWIAEIIVWALFLRLALGNGNIMHLYTDWNPHVWWNNPLLVTPVVAALLFVLDVTRDTTSLARAMSLPLFKKMGEVSYSVYLIHIGVIIMFKWWTLIRGIDGTFAISLIAFLIGTVMYYLIEEKGVDYGNRLIKYLKNEEDPKNLKQIHVELAETSNNEEVPNEIQVTQESAVSQILMEHQVTQESTISQILIKITRRKKTWVRAALCIVFGLFTLNFLIMRSRMPKQSEPIPEGLIIRANDTRIYLSESDWYTDASGYIETIRIGAYIQVDFNGSSFKLQLDNSSNNTLTTLAWTVDGAPEQFASPGVNASVNASSNASVNALVNAPGNGSVNGTFNGTFNDSIILTIASGLNKSDTHTLYLYVKNLSADRLRILSFIIDDNATLIAPKIPPKKIATLHANDSRIYHTDYNWHTDASGYIETINTGAYIKVDFNGTSFKLQLDNSFTNIMCTLAWTVDDEPEQSVSSGYNAPTTITIASRLKKNDNHTLYLFVRNFVTDSRWFNASTRLRIMSVIIDDDATLIAPTLAPKRLLAYWDSIGEGAMVNGMISWQSAHDAHVTWAFSVALALDVELSMVAFSHQGYVKQDAGIFPKLWNSSGLSNESAWDWLSVNHKRSFAICPDYILCGHGSNDKGLDQDQVYTNSLGWLKDMRKACPESIIFLIVPFGQWFEAAIVKAFQAYQASLESPDAQTHLIQMGERASQGLRASQSTFVSPDGFHPYGWKSSQLGALLVAKILPLLPK